MNEQNRGTGKQHVIERPLTQLDEVVLDAITKHPGYTAYDIADLFRHDANVYYSIYYLIGSGRADHDTTNGAIKVRDIQ